MMHSSHTVFWNTHLSIIEEYRQRRGLYAVIISLHDGPPKHLVDSFSKTLRDNGWLLTEMNAKFP